MDSKKWQRRQGKQEILNEIKNEHGKRAIMWRQLQLRKRS
jgi:hypothetical protein